MQKFFVLILIIIVSCGEQPTVDSLQPKPGDDSTMLTIEQVRRNYIETYNKPSSFSGLDEGKKGEEINISGKYYCVFDKGRTIPGKYIPESKQEFKTHNFAADIIIISNKDTILKKTITVRDFTGNISEDLSEYGVISEPVFCGYNEQNDQFDFHFSISIPLTNTATSRMVGIKRNGELAIRK
jgi:hypothetical protein